METAAVIRNSIESWRGSTVRWFLNRVNTPIHSTEAWSVDGIASSRHRWREIFSSSRASSLPVVRRRSVWMEQAELWGEEEEHADELGQYKEQPLRDMTKPAVVEPIHVEACVLEEAPARPLVAVAAKKLNYAEQGKSVQTEHIAKFLQINNAVDGACEAVSKFSLPRRSFAARFALWKGAPVGTNFVMGC